MNETLFSFSLFDADIVVTPWKIIGYVGVLCFGSRWIIQLVASHKSQRPTFPLLFWMLSLTGSILLLSYFTFGKNDSVGVLSNLMPAGVAGYNLILHIKDKRNPLSPPTPQSKG